MQKAKICPVCGKKLMNPNSKRHINSKYHQDALKKKKRLEIKVGQKTVSKKVVSDKVSTLDKTSQIRLEINEIKNQLVQFINTLNQSINYYNKKIEAFSKSIIDINSRIYRIEDYLKLKPLKSNKKSIFINKNQLIKIMKEIAKKDEGKYITFYDLREYIRDRYNVENENWEDLIEKLRDEGKIQFSKGAKSNDMDKGYKDSFNKVYYYFKLN
ncbi:MAG: hypothetical protein ACTSQO_12805 [Candidatus Helarchaeota archaeon]